MTDIVQGGKYRFIIQGTVVSDPTIPNTPLQLQDDSGTTHTIGTYIEASPVTPDNWPPVGGDVWQDTDGGLWVAYAEASGRFVHLLNAIGGARTSMTTDQFLSTWAVPTLVFRQGVVP